jgi:GT2 family glycosyltransferase
MRVAVLITCFNRAPITLRGLTFLFEAIGAQVIASFEVFLVDDASPDRTGALVKERFPLVHVIKGTGALFWNRGMCRAYAHAKAAGPFDAYLLFNDDVELMRSAVKELLTAYLQLNKAAPSVVSGPMCSRLTDETTYGGFSIVKKFRPATFERVCPNGTLQECDTFNGNFVLVPARSMDDLGGLDPIYHHSYGDIDLGLGLRRRNCKTYLLPGHIGYCEAETTRHLPPFRKRFRAMFVAPNPLSDQIHLTYKRYAWPLATVIALGQIIKRFSAVLFPQRN